jgi:AcrR family transcriptional regulator
MPRPKRTPAEIETMRERILDAAEVILHREGPQGLNIRSIANGVGVSHMVLYSYFDSRDDLFASLRDRQRRRHQSRHDEILKRAESDDIRTVMQDVLKNYITFAHQNPRIFRFLWGARPTNTPDEFGRCRHKGSKHGIQHEVQLLQKIIQSGIEKNEFDVDDAMVAAYLIMGMINIPSLLDQFLGTIDQDTLQKMEKEALNTCMNYLIGQKP